jgi:diphthine synthase
MTLSLISLGLRDERDMSLRALEEARACDSLYAELYTMKMDTTPKVLSELIGRRVIPLRRAGLEEKSESLLMEAEEQRVGILIGGDCLTATTHISLIVDARKMGISTEVIHSSSIITGVGETGLSIYKFGKTVTLPMEDKGPVDTVVRTLRQNWDHGLHTLVLLDLDMEKGRFMTIPQALGRLLEFKDFDGKTLVVGVARLGSDSSIIRAGTVESLAGVEFGGPPQALVFPGRLHFQEEEALKILAGCSGELLKEHKVVGELDRLIAKYIRECRRVLEDMELRDTPREIEGEVIENLLDHVERYLKDAEYYSTHDKPVALASVSYAEGILDTLKLINFAEFEW